MPASRHKWTSDHLGLFIENENYSSVTETYTFSPLPTSLALRNVITTLREGSYNGRLFVNSIWLLYENFTFAVLV